jgi:hypothetical protein
VSAIPALLGVSTGDALGSRLPKVWRSSREDCTDTREVFRLYNIPLPLPLNLLLFDTRRRALCLPSALAHVDTIGSLHIETFTF